MPFKVNYQVIQERFGQAYKEIQSKVVVTPYKLECFATQKSWEAIIKEQLEKKKVLASSFQKLKYRQA